MNFKVYEYIEKVFCAKGQPCITWGQFLNYLILCVKADGGDFNELHQYFEFPPNLTGDSWEIVSSDEIFEKWIKTKK